MKTADIERAIKLRERDARARMMADSCVAMAMQELSDEAPEEPHSKARAYAHRVAQLATALLVSGIYIEDAELRALKEENERLKQFASDMAKTRPPRLVIDAITR